jgi:predicted nicotinamide N-methyase
MQEDCSSIATRVWDCAVATTKWLEKAALMHTEQDVPWNLRGALQLSAAAVDNRPLQVLELGSGTGLLSIALAKMGAAVMSTEYGTAVAHLRRNCEVNNVEVGATSSTTLTAGRVCCRELDWYKTIETLQSLFQKPNDIAIFDLIAITDCSLSVKESMGVLNMIDKYGTHGHTRVLVGLCNEREGTSHFINASSQKYSKENMRVISSSEYHEDFPTTRHTILLIQL